MRERRGRMKREREGRMNEEREREERKNEEREREGRMKTSPRVPRGAGAGTRSVRSFPAGPKPHQVGATIPGSGRVVTSAILAAGAGDASHAVLAMTSDELFRVARAGLPPQKPIQKRPG